MGVGGQCACMCGCVCSVVILDMCVMMVFTDLHDVSKHVEHVLHNCY